jgi:hypothetical protein
VAVLSLLALFTHNAAFWVAALLLALIPVPDFWTPLASMADSLARMATRWAGASTAKAPSEPPEVVANYPPQAEAQAAPVPNEIAANGPPDDDALPPAPASSDHQRQVLSVGGRER